MKKSTCRWTNSVTHAFPLPIKSSATCLRIKLFFSFFYFLKKNSSAIFLRIKLVFFLFFLFSHLLARGSFTCFHLSDDLLKSGLIWWLQDVVFVCLFVRKLLISDETFCSSILFSVIIQMLWLQIFLFLTFHKVF